jgi:hypothetical protein
MDNIEIMIYICPHNVDKVHNKLIINHIYNEFFFK